MPIPTVTLITDFGGDSHLPSLIKGVISGIHPDTVIVDITHDIEPYNIVQASYILETVIDYFPSPSVHMVVVDPGVGSDRRSIISSASSNWGGR